MRLPADCLAKSPSAPQVMPFPCCRLKRWGLNCYMYAPKDELKHRLLWREPYTQHEAGSGSAGPQLGGCSHSAPIALHLTQAQAATTLPLIESCAV